ADLRQVAGAAQEVATVVVDIGGYLPGRKGRVQRVVLAAQQSLLLARDEQYEDGATRPLGQRGKGARDGQQLRTAGGIVLGAVVDLVPGLVWLTDAEVIVVRGIDHHFVFQLRIAAGQQAGDVRGAHARDVILEADRGAQVDGHGPELRAAGQLHQLVEIGAAGLQQPSGGVFRGPALELDARLVLGR